MSEGAGNRLYALFREHPALIASALYVVASAIGMFWSWAFLRNFGINVFNYAQISDFLLASLKEPMTWVLVLLSVVLVTADNAYSRRVARKGKSRWFRWYGSERYRFTNNFVAVIIIAMFIFTYAKVEADDARDGKGRIVDVAIEGEVRPATLLGTTGQFVFLYDVTAERVDVRPIESIESISFQAE